MKIFIYTLLGLELIFFLVHIFFQFKNRKYENIKYKNSIIFLLCILMTVFLTLSLKGKNNDSGKKEKNITLIDTDKENNTIKDINSTKNREYIKDTKNKDEISKLKDNNTDISVEEKDNESEDNSRLIKRQEINNSIEENTITDKNVSVKEDSQKNYSLNVDKVEKDWYKSNVTFICNETGNTFNIGWLEDGYLEFIFNSSMVLCGTTDIEGQALDNKIIYSCVEGEKSAIIEYYFTENKINVIDNFGEIVNYSGEYYLQ